MHMKLRTQSGHQVTASYGKGALGVCLFLPDCHRLWGVACLSALNLILSVALSSCVKIIPNVTRFHRLPFRRSVTDNYGHVCSQKNHSKIFADPTPLRIFPVWFAKLTGSIGTFSDSVVRFMQELSLSHLGPTVHAN